MLWRPSAIKFLSDKLAIVADERNHVLRTVTLDDGHIRTIVGKVATSGFADGVGNEVRLRRPSAFCVDPRGDYRHNVYFTDEHNHCIRSIDLRVSAVQTVTGIPPLDIIATSKENRGHRDGTLANCAFDSPCSITCPTTYGTGRRIFYVADLENHCVRCLDVDNDKVTTVVGEVRTPGLCDGASLTKCRLQGVHAVCSWRGLEGGGDDGDFSNLLIADRGNCLIRCVTLP
eukprot:PhF_6_TR21156/c1_g1_i1/m.30463